MARMSELELSPRGLNDSDLAALQELVQRCLSADGGLPDAASEAFVRRMYLSGPGVGVAAEDGTLIAAAALGQPDPNSPISAAGAVDPSCRKRGIGRALLDWTFEAAEGRPVLVASETVSESAERLYAHYGLRRTFAELVMRADLRTFAAGAALPPDGLEFRSWSSELAPAFFAAYDAAFRDRPGFPGWSEAQWIDWTVDDDDFEPELTKVALSTQDGTAAGFVTVGANWIVQMGVVPGWRRAGLGAALLRAAMSGIKGNGFDSCWLTVATNNPGAEALYVAAGFNRAGFRARYTTS